MKRGLKEAILVGVEYLAFVPETSPMKRGLKD